MDEQSIFLAALEKTHSAERAAYLDEACAANAALRRRIEALLKRYDDAGSFLERPPVELDATAVMSSVTHEEGNASEDDNQTVVIDRLQDAPLDFLRPSNKPGCLGTIGQYEINCIIGQGGMGLVLKAHDTKLHRVVAIKVLAPELAANAPAKQRFLREARAAAAVTHPHVVTIHAVDEDRVPYLVMELVDGMTLRQKLDTVGMLEVKEILRIGSQIAHGLAAAHRQGLIHRDVKPANILMENGVERVRITDFGLARAVSDLSVTRTGEVAGTPQYMSPEQAQGEPVDHRSDLFSLGSVLYSMCTGRPPFRGDNVIAVVRRVVDDTPRPIRELNEEIPEWLCEIIDTLLQKNPIDRYQSAMEVAMLLEQCLSQLQHPTPAPVVTASALAPKKGAGEPALQNAVSDDPGTRQQYKSRSAWRRVILPTGGIAVIAALAAVIISSTNKDGKTLDGSIHEEPNVDISSAKTNDKLELAELQRAVAVAADTQSLDEQADLRERLIAFNAPRLGMPEQIATAELMSRLLWPADLLQQKLIPQEELGYAGSQLGQPPDELVAVYGTGRLKHWGPVRAVAFSPDNRKLATAGKDGVIWVWNTQTGEPIVRLQDIERHYEAVGFTSDGSGLVSFGEAGFRTWDVATWEMRSAIRLDRTEFAGHWDSAWVAFSPDARLLVAAAKANGVVVYESQTGNLQHSLRGHPSAVNCVAFSGDGRLVASGDDTGTALLWDAASGELRKRVEAGHGRIWSVALNPDGDLLGVGHSDGTIALASLEEGESQRIIRIPDMVGNVGGLAFSPDGQRLLAGSATSGIGLREIIVETGRMRQILESGREWCHFPRYSPDGTTIACGYWHGGIGLWDAASGARRSDSPIKNRYVESVAASSDGSVVAACGGDLEVVVWNVQAQNQLRKLRFSGFPRGLRFTGEPNRLFTSVYGQGRNSPQTVEFWDALTGRLEQSLDIPSIPWSSALPAPSPDATFIVSVNDKHAVNVWERNGGERLTMHLTAEVIALAISADGSRIAAAGRDEGVHIWDARSGNELRELRTPPAEGMTLAFSPNGQILACRTSEPQIYLWETATGNKIAVLESSLPQPEWRRNPPLAYNPSGTLLASCWDDGTVRIWDTKSNKLRRRIAVGPPSGLVNAVAFLPDGRHLATANQNGTVFLLRVDSR
jgi:WD40 repeat protein/serine/threonine protein kinase